MKLRHYALVLTVLTVFALAFLAYSSEEFSMSEITFSKAGSLEGNYTFFLLATSTLIIMFTLFLQKVYETLEEKPAFELYVIPVLSVAALLFKAGFDVTLSRIAHTVLIVISAILVLRVISQLNNIMTAKNKRKQKKFLTAPQIAIAGTLIVFAIVGFNMIAEMFYLGTIISWMNYVSFLL